MQTGRSLLRVAVIIALTAPLTPRAGSSRSSPRCGRFKEANMLYGRADYTGAIEAYHEVLEVLGENPDSELAQAMTAAYFYLGNSYDNLYKPALRGDVENDAYLDQAIEYYALGSERSADPSLKTLSMQWLHAAYGPDKKNDPAASEAAPAGHDSARPGQSGQLLRAGAAVRGGGPLRGRGDRLRRGAQHAAGGPDRLPAARRVLQPGRRLRTDDRGPRAAAGIEPDNPEAYYTISTYYWEKPSATSASRRKRRRSTSPPASRPRTRPSG